MKIILINGSPVVGKSSLAIELASNLKIRNIIHSDVFKAAFRNREEEIFGAPSHEAWKYIGEKNKRNIIKGFEKQSGKYSAIITSSLYYFIDKGESVIVEGMQVLPTLLKQIDIPQKYGVFVDIPKKNQHLKLIKAKNADRGIKNTKWISNYDCIEVINEYIRQLATENEFLVIENINFDSTVKTILKYVQD